MAQQVQVELIGKDRASKEIQGVANTLERMKVSVETNKAGLGKLDNALKDSAANMLGLQGSAGRLADALLEFAPGGIIGGIAVAGIGLLISNFITTKEEQDKATDSLMKYLETSSKLAQSLNKLQFDPTTAEIKNLKIAFEDVDFAVNKTEFEFEKLKAKITESEALANILSQDFYGLSNPVGMLLARFVDVKGTVEELKKVGGELNTVLAEQANLMLQLQNIGMQQLNEDVKRLSTLRDLNKVGRTTKAEQEEIVYLTEKLTNLSKNLGATAEVRLISFNAIKVIQDDINKANQTALDNQRKLVEETKKQRDYYEALERKVLERWAAEEEAIGKVRKEQQQYFQEQLQAELSKGVTVVTEGISKDEEQAQKLNDLAEERMRTISSTVNSVAEGLDVMTQGLIDGQNGFLALGNGARAAARGILRAFAQEQIAKGVGALGDAFKATASGNLLSAGLFTKAATKHFAAAALAGVGAGAIGGGAGAGLGAGGFSNTQLGRVNFQGQQPLTIIVQGGSLLDMSNPDTVRSFTSALETVSSRRITINRVGA